VTSGVGRAGRAAAHCVLLAAIPVLMAAAWGVSLAPPAGAATPSPGCARWSAYGTAGMDGDVLDIPGPFFRGETLRFTIDPSTVGAVYLVPRDGDPLFVSETPGRFSVVLPDPVLAIAVATQGEVPGHWRLTHLSCVPSVTGPNPDITVSKAVGTTADGPWSRSLALIDDTTAHYRISVENLGDVPLTGVLLDDADVDLASVGCVVPDALAVGEAFSCTYPSTAAHGVHVNHVTAKAAEATPATAEATLEGVASDHRLRLTKGTLGNVEVTRPGRTITYVLTDELVGDSVDNVRLVDVLPAGLAYVAGSATDTVGLRFDGYDAPTRTLTWVAQAVWGSGYVTYRATVSAAAVSPEDTLHNEATIVSDATVAMTATHDLRVTSGPVPTMPPTDSLGSGGSDAPARPQDRTVPLAAAALAIALLLLGAVRAGTRRAA
jgi:uncharacterized repeat protein (TIGR01451 family)